MTEMNDSLEQALRSADASAPARAARIDPDAIFDRVASRRRRRITVRATGATALLLVVVVSVIGNHRTRTVAHLPPSALTAPQIQADRDSLAQIEAQAARQEKLVDRLLEMERASRMKLTLQRLASRPTPQEQARQQIEQAALVMVHQADQIARHSSPSGARQIYTEVVEYFPATQWAQVARQRIAPLQMER